MFRTPAWPVTWSRWSPLTRSHAVEIGWGWGWESWGLALCGSDNRTAGLTNPGGGGKKWDWDQTKDMLIKKIMRLITKKKKKKDFPSRWGEIKIYCNAGCYSPSVTDLWNGNCKDKQGKKNQYLYFCSQANEAAAPVMLHTVTQALDAAPGMSKDKAAFNLLPSSSTILFSLFHHYSFSMFTLKTTKRIF